MLGRTEEVEVLRALYATALPDDGGWTAFLHRLAGLTRARSAMLVLDSPGARATWQTGAPLDPPAAAILRQMRAERVYAQSELDSAQPMRALRVALRPAGQIWLLIARPFEDFRAADGAHLDRLAPHLEQAADIWLRLSAERTQAGFHAVIAAALAAGWLTFDPALRVTASDAGARNLIARARGVTLHADGRFEADDGLLMRDLRRGIDRVLSAGGPVPVLDLDRSSGLQLALLPCPASNGATVSGFLRAGLTSARLSPEILAQRFGLNRAEARLALQLTDGNSLTEAAGALGWTIETARSCSKRIFGRLGLRGQPDLMRHILNSAVWFDHPEAGR